MYKVSVMYPSQEDGTFDFRYYKDKHMVMVEEHLRPYGLVKTTVERGISGGGGAPAPYVCIGSLFFESEDGYDRGTAEVGHILRGDIVNYTNIKPVRQVSEIL